MSGFKLLAIRPLKGCNPDYLKALKEDKLYQFYNDYNFHFEDNDPTKKIISVTHEPTIPQDLFNIGDLTVNISALVGKNGSGKSSLIDLFFAVVYNFSMNRGLLDVDVRYKPEQMVLSELKVQVVYELNDIIFILDTKSIGKDRDKLEISISNEVKLTAETKQQKREFKLSPLLDNEAGVLKTLLSNLFYTVAVNYSVYSLNNRHIGAWINYLFHKNDGYKAPIVINPMRHEGNFDINKEMYLSKSRLLANIIHPDYIDKANTLKITEYQCIEHIYFKLDLKRFSSLVYTTPEELHVNIEDFYLWNGGKTDFLDKINNVFFKGDLFSNVEKVKYGDEVLTYIVRKLFKIASKYESYNVFLKGEYPKLENYHMARIHDFDNFLKFENFTEYLNILNEDESHVTFKLRQAINYLKNNPLKESEDCTHHISIGFKITAKELSTRIKEIDTKEAVINLLPPSLFEVDFELIDETRQASKYNQLSSGEQQLIQSTQSVAYHLINLNSVFGKPAKDKRPTYDSVNLILDEIELYFHPDTQRKYVKYLLDTIERLELTKINSINILMATHSPFVLSDIPIVNTLRLKDKGEPSLNHKESETFGANIHDLLANDFFLDSGFMGEFSKKYLNNIILKINEFDSFSKEEADTLHSRIKIIGEVFIKQKLTEMVIEKTTNSEKDKIQSIIDFKKAEIEQLMKEQRNVSLEDDKNRK